MSTGFEIPTGEHGILAGLGMGNVDTCRLFILSTTTTIRFGKLLWTGRRVYLSLKYDRQLFKARFYTTQVRRNFY